MKINCNITDLSLELLCQILDYLPLREVLSVAMLCKKMSTAVDMHLRLCKSIDFCQDTVCGYMPSSITDDHLLCLLKKCPHLEIVYGLHPVNIERRRLRKRSALTIPGTIEALSLCFNLKAIETSDLKLLEAIMQHLPQLEIIGHFQNRDGTFPPQASQRLKLQPYPRVSSLHLIGVEVPELTAMPHLQHLHLQCVRFTKLQPFRAFLAQNLKSFTMKHCIGPSIPQRYLSLIIALSSSPNLSRLELVRVPLLNGLFQRAVEDSYRHNGFVNLRTLVIAGCKGILEADLGYLMIVASQNLETLYVQPSLTKDSLFVSLSYAQCSFPKLQNLHLGFIDNLKSSGEWTNGALLSLGLAEVPDTPSSITDSGMKVISQLFLNIEKLSVSNCPHLMLMHQWMPAEDLEAWSKLTDLTLQKCHCLQLSSFALFLSFLQKIQVVILNDMFREPPKGCSHVGLSAGTGLGMSSAVVSNQDEHIAVQGHQQDFEQQGDDENEEIEREFIDIENDDNPEPQFMVLQQNFFDGEDDDGVDGDEIMAEGQYLEQGHNEHDGPENLDDSPNNDHAMDTINSDCNSSKPSATYKIENDTLTSSVANDQSESRNVSRYNLRQKYKKSSKSVCVSNVNSNLNKRKEALDSKEISSDDKTLVMPQVVDSNYIQEYDPHKPSTSKAGRHLDYYVTYNTKPCNISDSESDSDYKYSLNSKKLKKSPSKQSFSKKVKKQKLTNLAKNNLSTKANSSLKNGNDENATTENYIHPNKSSEVCTGDSNIHSKSINCFSDHKYPSMRMCKVVVTRYEEEKLLNDPPNNELSEPEIHSSSKTDIPTPGDIDNLNFKFEHKISSASVFDSMPKELEVGYSNSNKEKLCHRPIIIRCKPEISMDSVHKGSEEKNSSVSDEHLLKCRSCYVSLEKLNIETHSTIKNCKSETLSENKNSEVNYRNSSEVMSSSDCAHGIESEVKDDRHLENVTGASVIDPFWIEMDDEIAHFCINPINNTDSKSLNDFAETDNAQVSKHKVEINSNCSEVEMCEIGNFCASSNKDLEFDDSSNNSFNKTKPKVTNSSQDTKLKAKIKLDKSNVIQNDVSEVKMKQTIKGENGLDKTSESNEIQILKTVCANKNRTPKNSKCLELPFNDEHIQSSVKRCHVHLTRIDDNLSCSKLDSENQDKNGHFCNKSFDATSENTDSEHLNSFKTINNMHVNPAIVDHNYSSLFSTKENKNEILKHSHANKNATVQDNSIENVSMLSEVKPCYVLVTKIDKMPLSIKNENSSIYNPQPLTSNSGININNHSTNPPRYNRKSKSARCEILAVSANNKHENSLHRNNNLEIESRENNILDPELKPSSSKKRLKISRKDHDDEHNYYAVVSKTSDRSVEVVNSSTGESYKIPSISILVSQSSSENTNELHLKSKVKTKTKCNTPENLNNSQSELNSNYNPYLPSTSKDIINIDCELETRSLQITNVKDSSRKHPPCDTRRKKRIKASKICSNIEIKKEKDDDMCSKNEKSDVSQTCAFPNSSAVSAAPSDHLQKLKITNSDATLLTKRCHVKENSRFNSNAESTRHGCSSKANNAENSFCCPYWEDKWKRYGPHARTNTALEKNSSEHHNNNIASKTNDSSTPRERKRKCEACRKKMKLKKIAKIKKQLKEHFKCPKSNSTNGYSAKKSPKKILPVPMVTLISQGTQATSSDIRRSVRRARRTTTGTHKVASFSHVSRRCSHRSKVSSKMVHKIPASKDNRPELQDKSTSTSDPLLEDDAVQTLQLTSNSLLSFTVVSCGISHLIIDLCPQLVHIEAQACRIFKKIQLKTCPALKKLNISQCPKLSICALVDPVLSLTTNSYVLVSFEPCMQGYHPGEGEKAILSRALLNQSVLICHDFSEVSHDGMQAKFQEKLIIWLRYLATLCFSLKYAEDITKLKMQTFEISQTFNYPWSHDIQKINGRYAYPPSSESCATMGRYQLVTNNPILRDLFETSRLDTGFPTINDCEAYRNNSLLSYEKIEKYIQMKKKFVAFYIPITESNKINIYK